MTVGTLRLSGKAHRRVQRQLRRTVALNRHRPVHGHSSGGLALFRGGKSAACKRWMRPKCGDRRRTSHKRQAERGDDWRTLCRCANCALVGCSHIQVRTIAQVASDARALPAPRRPHLANPVHQLKVPPLLRPCRTRALEGFALQALEKALGSRGEWSISARCHDRSHFIELFVEG